MSSSSLLDEKPSHHGPYSLSYYYRLFILPVLMDASTRRLFYFSLFTLCFTVLEIMVGMLTGSLSLLSDGLHMGFDSLVLTANLAVSKSVLATTTATKLKPFGWLRTEPLAGLLNAGLLMMLSLNVAVQALYRLFFSPAEELQTGPVMAVAFVGLVINLFGIFAFNGATHAHCLANHAHVHADAHHSHGHHHGACHNHHLSLSRSMESSASLAITIESDHLDKCPHSCSQSTVHQPNMFLQGMFLHVLTDALGSLSVILSSLVIRYTGWTVMDPLCSLALSGLILKVSWPLLSESVCCLLDWAPTTVDMVSLEQALHSIEPAMTIELLRVWSLARNHNIATLRVVLNGQPCSDKHMARTLYQSLRQILEQYHIWDTTIEIQ